jgi:hypothetical protein
VAFLCGAAGVICLLVSFLFGVSASNSVTEGKLYLAFLEVFVALQLVDAAFWYFEKM